MTVDRFMRLVALVGNSTWVRYYLASYPGQMVLEVANLDGANLGALRSELAVEGFQELPITHFGDVEVHRFSVTRDDEARQSAR